MLEYKVITLNDENAIALENLRFKVYDYKNIEPTETYFYREIKNGKILPFGVYENNKLIASCYVSNSYKTLFILALILLIYMALRNIPYFDYLKPTIIK